MRQTLMLLLAIVAAGGLTCAAEDAGLAPGDEAPAFSLQGSDGKTHSLADYAGKAVVIAWFPKAFTGG